MLRLPLSLGFHRKEIQSDIFVQKMHIWIHWENKYKSKSTAMLQSLNMKYDLEKKPLEIQSDDRFLPNTDSVKHSLVIQKGTRTNMTFMR